MWSRLLTRIIIALFTVLATSHYATPRLAAADAINFTGRLALPHDLVTSDGTRLEKGNCKLQVRAEGDRYWLSFVRDGMASAELEGQVRETNFADSASVPLSGTLRMVPDKSLGRKSGGGRRASDDWFGRPRAWNAAMRTYRSVDPNHREVLFVFQANLAPNRWCRVEFKLLITGQNIAVDGGYTC